MTNNCQSTGGTIACPPVRNRYFYGKMLDVFHFEMEQSYMNDKRWLLNRLVSGYGVVCGLNVTLASDGQSVVVSPGLAIDKCGREIIVCQPSDPYPLPPPQVPPPSTSGGGPTPPTETSSTGTAPAATGGPTLAPPPPKDTDCTDSSGVYKHLCICYHECAADPSPALGGDCDTQAMCTPGSIREKYCLKFCDGKLCPASTTSPLQSVISGGALNYSMLATYIANLQCLGSISDCCIPLANVQVPSPGQPYTQNLLDIGVRPLQLSNDILYGLILALLNQGQPQLQGGK